MVRFTIRAIQKHMIWSPQHSSRTGWWPTALEPAFMGSANVMNERPVSEPQLGAANGSFVSEVRHRRFAHLERQQFALLI